MTHDELQEDLARQLRGNTDRMVWTNMQLGPAGSPRPDVFTVNKSFSRFRTDCYEVKFSVSDLRSDVTSGKWQSYRKFGHAVWFAFQKGLVPLDTIPRECGVIVRGETGLWRAARKPVAQVLDTLPRDAWMKLLLESFPTDMLGEPKRRRSDSYHGEDILRRKLGDKLAVLFRDCERAEATLEHRKAKLDADLNAIDVQKEARRKQAEADATRIAGKLDENMRKLGAALNIPDDEIDAVRLLQAIEELRTRMQGGGIEKAIALLQGLQGVLPANDPSIYRRGW